MKIGFLLISVGLFLGMSVAEAVPPTGPQIDQSCQWYSRRSSRVRGDLGQLAHPQVSCNLGNGGVTVCTGYIKCDKDFMDSKGKNFGRIYLKQGIDNPVVCVTNKECEDVSASECYLDSHGKPDFDDMDTVIYGTPVDTKTTTKSGTQ